MAVAMAGVIAAAVVIITVGAEAEAITMAGGIITAGKRHESAGSELVTCVENTESSNLLTTRRHLGTWTRLRIRQTEPRLDAAGISSPNPARQRKGQGGQGAGAPR